MTRIHASCVAIDGRAVLIEGPSGSGKSDLALRLIDRGATLVSDDYTELTELDGQLIANAPDTIRGKVEVRGVGIVVMPASALCRVALLIRAGTPERMPERQTCAMAGIAVPMILLSLTEPSAPLKVELALRELGAARS